MHGVLEKVKPSGQKIDFVVARAEGGGGAFCVLIVVVVTRLYVRVKTHTAAYEKGWILLYLNYSLRKKPVFKPAELVAWGLELVPPGCL